MANLSEDEKLKYHVLFQSVAEESEDGTGELNMENFEKLLVLCGHRLPRETVVTLFVETDRDGDWKISSDEFLDFISQVAPSGSPQSVAASLRRKFNENDADKDGFISFEELKAVVSDGSFVQSEGWLSSEWLQGCMKEWDTDGDGKINFEEFVTMAIKAELVDSDDDEEEQKEQEEGMKEYRDILLSADTIRRICTERGLVEDGCVPVEDLKLILTEVRVQMNDEQLEASIKQLDREGRGKVNLEAFVGVFEDITSLEDDADSRQEQVKQQELVQTEEKDEEESTLEISEEEPPMVCREQPPVTFREETPKRRTASDSDVKKIGAAFENKKRGTPTSATSSDDGANLECKNAGVKGLISRLEGQRK